MTRPMPGPPEKYQLLGPMVIVWEGGSGYYYHPGLMDAKRLTDAECAAEHWRAALEATSAALNNCPECPGCQSMEAEELTWHRFATHPHALEES